MKLWSSRSETNASAFPSGDQDGDSLEPRAKNACSAGAPPSIGGIQIRLALTNATRSPAGAIAGSSPSPSSFGAPPVVAIDQICTRGCVALAAGFGCRLPSAGQLAP